MVAMEGELRTSSHSLRSMERISSKSGRPCDAGSRGQRPRSDVGAAAYWARHPTVARLRIVQIAPEKDIKLPSTVEEMEQHFRETGSPEAATSRLNAPHPLMHCTETVDFGILIDGELTLILDDSEVQLKPGDIVVQRGTNHAWSNRGDKPCRIAFVLLDDVTPRT